MFFLSLPVTYMFMDTAMHYTLIWKTTLHQNFHPKAIPNEKLNIPISNTILTQLKGNYITSIKWTISTHRFAV